MFNQTGTSTSGPLPTSSASEAEFAEDQYFDALVAGDVERIEELLTTEFLIVDVMSGGVVDRPSFIAALRDGLVGFERVHLIERSPGATAHRDHRRPHPDVAGGIARRAGRSRAHGVAASAAASVRRARVAMSGPRPERCCTSTRSSCRSSTGRATGRTASAASSSHPPRGRGQGDRRGRRSHPPDLWRDPRSRERETVTATLGAPRWFGEQRCGREAVTSDNAKCYATSFRSAARSPSSGRATSSSRLAPRAGTGRSNGSSASAPPRHRDGGPNRDPPSQRHPDRKERKERHVQPDRNI